MGGNGYVAGGLFGHLSCANHTYLHNSYEHLCRSDARDTIVRFKTHHEGADYDNPEEVMIHDTEQGIELIVTHAKDGFRVTMWNRKELKRETIRFEKNNE